MKMAFRALSFIFIIITGPAYSAGFALIENSASGLGNAFAGGSAVSEDASVVWFNPAGMSKLEKPNLTAAVHLIKTSGHFNNNGSTPPIGLTASGNGGDFGGLHIVPNAYLTLPFNEQISFGLGINAPFGLVTEYQDNWIGRAQGIHSDIRTININPSISLKLSEQFAVGFGINAQRLDAELTSTAIAAAGGGLITINADDTAYGYNLGFLLTPLPKTQIGIHYRSPLKYDLRGRANFNGASAGLAVDIRSDLKLPSTLSLSVLQQINSQWDAMADVTYTKWSSIPELRYIRTANAAGGAAFGTAGSTLEAIALNWENTWRASMGASYRYSDQLKLRIGIAYDQTPVPDTAHSIVRLPDGNRNWLSVGAQYKVNKDWKFDFGYTYIKVRTAQMDSSSLTNSSTKGVLMGSFKNDIHILAAQFNYQF